MSVDADELYERSGGALLRFPPRTGKRVSKRVRRAVADALREQRPRQEERQAIGQSIEIAEATNDVRVSLPRPARIRSSRATDDVLPRRREQFFVVPFYLLIARLGAWLLAAMRFIGGNILDIILRRDDEERRAVRLRETLQRAGTTFIKVGQQLSIRLDLVPYVYARELEKLLDAVPPFPVEEAIRIIERTTGRPVGDMYAAIDPKPIGSASVACVFQAVRHDGRRVAIKVRRPRVGELISADMDALELVLGVLEIAWLPPGFTSHFTRELRTMLIEELDFVQEGRFTDLFRLRARKEKIEWLTAPGVHFDLSTGEVLVTDFITGVWVNDLLGALENGDPAMRQIREMDINPKVVARRFLQANRFGGFENVFFHADLHPANVVVQPGNKLTLIDFGSCGAFPKRELHVWRRLMDAQEHEDVGGMVQAVLALLEPLPPIDIDEFQRRLETLFWQDLYAIKDKNSMWWERTSANIWISFLKLAREYSVPMNLNTLRMIRATMLADTVAARLDHHINPYNEFRKYERRAGVRSRRRIKRGLREVLSTRTFVRIEQLLESSFSAMFRVQRLVDGEPLLNFTSQVGKAAYAFKLLMDFVGMGLVWTSIWYGVTAYQMWDQFEKTRFLDDFASVTWSVINHWHYWVGVFLTGVVLARRLHHRLHGREQKSRRVEI
jgi:ubiquinone biosynthesis protein